MGRGGKVRGWRMDGSEVGMCGICYVVVNRKLEIKGTSNKIVFSLQHPPDMDGSS